MTQLWSVLVLLIALGDQSFQHFTEHLQQLPEAERAVRVQAYLSKQGSTPLVEGDSLVHFIYFGQAETVLLNGDLQAGWSRPDTMRQIYCGGERLFYRSYTLPPDARLDYLFIIDGVTRLDPRNPRMTPSGFGPHSELRMPAFEGTETIRSRAEIEHGRIDSTMFVSQDTLLKPRKVKIYTPAGYDRSRQLATLYVHDGEDALRFNLFLNILDNLIADGRVAPLLAVFIPPVEREAEYVGDKRKAFSAALCNELVPLIERRYGTARDPAKRAMMGISNGGHISLATVLARHDVFRNVAGQSSFITPYLHDLVDTAANFPGVATLKIYIDVGRYDLLVPGGDQSLLRLNQQFSQTLCTNGIEHIYVELNDGHQWANWRERTGDILVYFFGTVDSQ